MINGELGLKEISEYIENRMMNFWFQVETGEESKISTILCKWIKILHNRNSYSSPWIQKIETTLEHTGMSSLFDVVANTSKSWFKNNTKIRLNNLYAHKWSEAVFNNSVCLNYRVMTVVKKTQNYILKLPKKYVYILCKFKCANHHLPIVEGRYTNTPVHERTCTLCTTNDIGDEFHYLFNCTFFHAQRVKHLMRYYYINPNTSKMMQLFESPDYKEMINLAKFVDLIMKQFRSK